MELDLTGQLGRRAEAPMASESSAAMEKMEVSLELSLGWSSGEIGCRKRVRENDEAFEGKKPEKEVGLVPYSLQVMPVILHGWNGHCCASMVLGRDLCSANVFENGVYMPGGNRNLAVDGVVTADGGMVVSGGGGLSSPGSANSGTSVIQKFSANGEDISTNESRSHSNSSPISSVRNSKPELKKLLAHTKGRRKAALNQKRKTLVHTRSVEGKKTDGYLYECSKDEVIILCSCHGSFFSPAGFVRHAGGPVTLHPLRQITVISP